MFAIVEIAGKQYKVRESDRLFVPRQQAPADSKLSFDDVLLVADGESIVVGQPTVAGASVSATVLGHVKADKVLVFKKKRRKHFRVKRGHRQPYTEIQVDGVTLNGRGKAAPAKKKAAPAEKKAAPAKAAAPEAPAPKAAPKKAAPEAAAKPDKLTRIEGIGPKYASVLAEGGVETFAAMAASTPEALSEILTTANARYASADTSTWPEQAALAAAGDWEALDALQAELDGGRRD